MLSILLCIYLISEISNFLLPLYWYNFSRDFSENLYPGELKIGVSILGLLELIIALINRLFLIFLLMLSVIFKVYGTGFDVLFFLASSIDDIRVHNVVFDWGTNVFSKNNCFIYKILGGS